mmetsp:Transcript_10964/g.20063  ORF Transcript_10964/g.20063 Transcript_10964/m.20063 type:complete len:221 (+) Transcript_10964:213-875(+)
MQLLSQSAHSHGVIITDITVIAICVLSPSHSCQNIRHHRTWNVFKRYLAKDVFPILHHEVNHNFLQKSAIFRIGIKKNVKHVINSERDGPCVAGLRFQFQINHPILISGVHDVKRICLQLLISHFTPVNVVQHVTENIRLYISNSNGRQLFSRFAEFRESRSTILQNQMVSMKRSQCGLGFFTSTPPSLILTTHQKQNISRILIHKLLKDIFAKRIFWNK